jgi:hypothetical protein
MSYWYVLELELPEHAWLSGEAVEAPAWHVEVSDDRAARHVCAEDAALLVHVLSASVV